jgi:small-conductance mechanosensitive channel
MGISEFLNHNLIRTENFNLNVYGVLIVIGVVIVTIIALKLVRRIFKRFIASRERDQGVYWSVFLFVKYLTWVIVVIVLLDTVGVRISVLLASIAALLVGVGLGIQQLFNDIASGLVLIIERNLQINDVIQLDDDTVGKVIEIGLRTSKIKTRDDIVMIVPNSKFVNDRIINWSHIDFKTRFCVEVGVAYGSDIKLVSELLKSCASIHSKIANKPAPFVRFNNFGESSLDFQLYFWVKETFLVENIKSDLRFAIDDAFRKNGVTIPFPQRDVHLKK